MQTSSDTPTIELAVSPGYIARLIVKMRGIQGREGLVDPDPGSNPTDDRMIDTLQEEPGDLSRTEIFQEIAGLSPDQQNELVALMWLGRGDFEPAEWTVAVRTAAERREQPTASISSASRCWRTTGRKGWSGSASACPRWIPTATTSS